MNIRDDFIISKLHKGYLVGGAVRDFLLGKDRHSALVDRDIAIQNAEEFANELAKKFDGTFIVLDNENKIFRVVLSDKINYLDISEIVGKNIQEDILRRDFTINAIAYDLEKDEFVDITGGMEDLKNKKLRPVREENFKDDPLRILRAFRFLSTTGFEITEELQEGITKYLPLATEPAKERIHYELMKLFGGKYCAETLLLMDNFGILEQLFPCVRELKLVPPNTHHHLDLFHHVIETVRNIELLYESLPPEGKKHMDSVDFGGFSRINHLKLAGFLHDIGKYSTWTIENGKCDRFDCLYNKPECSECGARHRFIKHDEVGSKMCVPILRELKFSKRQIDYISNMIKHHIYPSNVLAAPYLSDKVMMRYLRKMENNVIDNIILAKADRLSARGPAITDEMVKSNLEGLDKLLNFYFEKKDTLKPLPKLIDGNEIMQMRGIPQSPLLGEIITLLREAQYNGDITTREEAELFIKNYPL